MLRFNSKEYWTQIVSDILLKLKNFWSSYVSDTNRQVATVVMEIAQLVLSQFNNF